MSTDERLTVANCWRCFKLVTFCSLIFDNIKNNVMHVQSVSDYLQYS